jgi:hypothetical protein
VRFELEHRLPGPVDEVLDVLVDPDFVPRLAALPRVEPQLLDHRAEGRVVRQRVRYRFTGDLPGAVTAVLDPDRLTWVDDVAYDLAQATSSFRIVPDHYPQRLSCAGTMRFVGQGDRSTRRVHGELRVRYPLVGRTAERAILAGIEEHLAAEVDLIRTILRERP